jgi:hypothetical protein
MAITVDQARERIAQIRTALQHETETIRGHKGYSDTGRRLELAKAYRKTRTQAAALREEFTAENRARRRELEKRLFGIPSGGDAAAYRDAVDRAEKVINAEAAEAMLARALRTGDDLLARAVADRARQLGANNVVQSYADDAGMTNALEQLGQVQTGEKGIGVTVLFGVRAPEELHGLENDGALDDFITRTENTPTPTHNGRHYDPLGMSTMTH